MHKTITAPWDTAAGPYIIAEIGSNHDGSKERALALIKQCAKAGADAAKFQLFKAQTLVVGDHPAFDTLARLSTPLEWLPELAQTCKDEGIGFCATPFDLEAVDALAACRPTCIKIASSDITYVQLLRRCAATGLPLVLSTGMSTFDEVRNALDCLRLAASGPVALLHCVSMYPPAYEHMNLSVIPLMMQKYGLAVGLSDHTPASTMSVAAVALGGSVVEKHVTDDRSRPGPDHGYALEFAELEQLAADLKHTAQALGDGDKRPRDAENIISTKARRGLYAARDIAAGEILNAEAVVALRPTAEIQAEQIDGVIGATAPCAVAKGAPLPATLLGGQ